MFTDLSPAQWIFLLRKMDDCFSLNQIINADKSMNIRLFLYIRVLNQLVISSFFWNLHHTDQMHLKGFFE